MSLARIIAALTLLVGLWAGGNGVARSQEPGAEPPPVPVAAVPYYVASEGKSRGPLALDVILAEIGEGTILPWTLVWKPGLSAWIRAGALLELTDALAAATPKPPPPPPEPPPPPPDLPAEDIFYTADGGEVRGPFTPAEIETAIATGTVTRATLVWQPGADSWVAARDVPSLRGAFAAKPPEVPLADTMRQLMVGTWEFVSEYGDGMVARSTLQYRPDMTFSGFVTLTLSGTALSTNPVAGEWSVTGATTDRFALTVSPAVGSPGTVQLRVVDRDNLVNETDGGTARRIGE
jgi:hypothetical protein